MVRRSLHAYGEMVRLYGLLIPGRCHQSVPLEIGLKRVRRGAQGRKGAFSASVKAHLRTR